MATDLVSNPFLPISLQAAQPMEWYVPRLKTLWRLGGRDMAARTTKEWVDLGGLNKRDTHYVIQCAVADGFMESDGRGRWGCTEQTRLSFADTEVAARDAMPLVIARHQAVYAVNYQYEFDQLDAAALGAVYDRHRVAEPWRRAAAFLSAQRFAKLAQSGDQEEFRKFLRTLPLYEAIPRSRRAQQGTDAGVMEEAEEEVPAAPPAPLAAALPAIPSPVTLRIACLHCHGTGSVLVRAEA